MVLEAMESLHVVALVRRKVKGINRKSQRGLMNKEAHKAEDRKYHVRCGNVHQTRGSICVYEGDSGVLMN